MGYLLTKGSRESMSSREMVDVLPRYGSSILATAVVMSGFAIYVNLAGGQLAIVSGLILVVVVVYLRRVVSRVEAEV